MGSVVITNKGLSEVDVRSWKLVIGDWNAIITEGTTLKPNQSTVVGPLEFPTIMDANSLFLHNSLGEIVDSFVYQNAESMYYAFDGVDWISKFKQKGLKVFLSRVVANSPRESITITNGGGKEVDVGYWEIVEDSKFTFPIGTKLQPNQSIVVGGPETDFHWPELALGNKGDDIALWDDFGEPLDEFSYSRARENMHFVREGDDWVECNIPKPAVILTRVVANNINESITVTNTGIKDVNIGDWKIGGGSTFIFPPDTILEPKASFVIGGPSTDFHWPDMALGNNGDDIDLQDKFGDSVDKFSYSLAQANMHFVREGKEWVERDIPKDL